MNTSIPWIVDKIQEEERNYWNNMVLSWPKWKEKKTIPDNDVELLLSLSVLSPDPCRCLNPSWLITIYRHIDNTNINQTAIYVSLFYRDDTKSIV